MATSLLLTSGIAASLIAATFGAPPESSTAALSDETTFAMTVMCDTTKQVGLPLDGATGTVRWSDGITEEVTSSYVPWRTAPAGVELHATFEGTYDYIGAIDANWTYEVTPYASLDCFRSVDAWAEMPGLTSYAASFSGMTELTSVPDHLPANVTNLQQVFGGSAKFDSPNVSSWDTSGVTNLSFAFYGTAFNQPLDGWDTSSVTDFSRTFYLASAFNQPLATWDVSAATTMSEMFTGAYAFQQDLTGWQLPAGTDADSFAPHLATHLQPQAS